MPVEVRGHTARAVNGDIEDQSATVLAAMRVATALPSERP